MYDDGDNDKRKEEEKKKHHTNRPQEKKKQKGGGFVCHVCFPYLYNYKNVRNRLNIFLFLF